MHMRCTFAYNLNTRSQDVHTKNRPSETRCGMTLLHDLFVWSMFYNLCCTMSLLYDELDRKSIMRDQPDTKGTGR